MDETMKHWSQVNDGDNICHVFYGNFQLEVCLPNSRILFPSNDLFDSAYTSDNLSDLKESHYELWMRNKK